MVVAPALAPPTRPAPLSKPPPPSTPSTQQYMTRKRQILMAYDQEREEEEISPQKRRERRKTPPSCPVKLEVLETEEGEDKEMAKEVDEEAGGGESVLRCSYLNFEALEAEPVALVTMPQMASSSSSFTSARFRKRMTAYLKGVRRAWDFACGRMLAGSAGSSGSSQGTQALRFLVTCHLGLTRLTRQELKRHLVRLARLLRHFALLQPEFAELSRHDQRQLLGRNAPLFLQFVLGRYLTAKTPAEQVSGFLCNWWGAGGNL